MKKTAAALALATVGLCAATPALALTIANVDVPGQQSVAGRDLTLNGAGLRQRFVFHVYVAALYRPKASGDAEEILTSPEPQMLRLTLLRESRGIKPGKKKSIIISNIHTYRVAPGDLMNYIAARARASHQG